MHMKVLCSLELAGPRPGTIEVQGCILRPAADNTAAGR